MRLCVLLSSSAINRTKSKILKKVKSDDTTDHTICTITAIMTSGEKLRERAICLKIDDITIKTPTEITGEISTGEFRVKLNLRNALSHGSQMRASSLPKGL